MANFSIEWRGDLELAAALGNASQKIKTQVTMYLKRGEGY